MKISRVQIQNFRNIRNVDVQLGDVVTLIGENNSGKSNFLYALTLPFLSDDNNLSKNLSWADINSEARDQYYQFILERKDDILNETLPFDDFVAKLPVVFVEVDLIPEEKELYCVKDICHSVDADGNLIYGLRYEYKATHPEEILSQVRSILNSEQIDRQSIENIRMNLLPTRMYGYSVIIPQKDTKVAYDTLRQFKYMALSADRDNFSNTNERIGSRSLVKLLQMRLSDADLLTVEKEYSHFFDALKNLSGMDQVINWQDNSEIPNAKDFFIQKQEPESQRGNHLEI